MLLQPNGTRGTSTSSKRGEVFRASSAASGLATALALAWLCSTSAAVEAQVAVANFYVTNGAVHATALAGNTLYIAGNFTRVGPATGGGVPFDAVTGLPVRGFPRVTGYVAAIAPDGSGGWYIGGQFTAVGGVPRHNVARILADQTLASWDPDADYPVYALVASGSTVYVGGQFGNIGGQARSKFAALDASTGLATPWHPAVGGRDVFAIAVDATRVYVSSGSRIFAFDGATGLLAWSTSSADGGAYALAVTGTTLYAGGAFTSFGGQARTGLAALDVSTGLVTGWNANANNYPVLALAVNGTTLYAEGNFSNIGGQPRDGLAALDATTGLATPWYPAVIDANALSSVGDAALASSGSTVYVGSPLGIVALDALTGSATGWNPDVHGQVGAIAVNGGAVYLGGNFIVGGEERNHFAALDVRTGLPTAWNPNAEGSEYLGGYTVTVNGSTVYAAGDFTSIGGQPRNHIAALDATSGLATSWNPSAVFPPPPGICFTFALAAKGGTVYVAGPFTSIGGQPRNQIAALDASTGLATAWNPGSDISSCVGLLPSDGPSLAVRGATIYIAGPFSSIGGQTRVGMAALDATTGLATSWNPNPGGQSTGGPYALALSGSTVYASGDFTTIGGQPRNHIAALDATTGLATDWNPDAGGHDFDSSVRALAVSGTTVYAGGFFTTIGGQLRNNIAALDAKTGAALDWDPGASYIVNALATGGGNIYAGGFFGSMSNLPQSFIAAVPRKEPAGRGASRAGAQGTLSAGARDGNPNVFEYSLPGPSDVTIAVYDIAGRRVAALEHGAQSAGAHAVTWGAKGVPRGIYFYHLQAGSMAITKSVLILK